MKDRYEITFKEGGVSGVETIITGGITKVVEKTLDTITNDDNHGWYCKIRDKVTNLESQYWGATKEIAQEKAFNDLKNKIEEYEYEQEKLFEQEKKHQEYKASSISSDDDTDGFSLYFYLVITEVSHPIKSTVFNKYLKKK